MSEFIKIKKDCIHFNNNIEIFAECCNKYYKCYLCHNNENDHKIKAKKIKVIKCLFCNKDNSISNKCYNCNQQFAKSYCYECKFWCNNIKKYFHCNKSKKCYYGSEDNYNYCKECNRCIPINDPNNHKCILMNSNKECPICFEDIIFIKDKVFNKNTNKILKCNHLIHTECYESLVKNTEDNKIILCPFCKKSVLDPSSYENKFDKIIKNNKVEKVYDNWISNIYCNDCNLKSDVKYHYKFHKCINCKSYNTYIENIQKNS